MPISLNENYWKEHFYLTPFEIDQLYEYIKKEKQPLPLEEIAETIVRNLFEREEREPNLRVYSPERKYKIREKIFFIRGGGKRYAKILDISTNHSSTLFSKEIIYDRITVQFLDNGEIAKFVSNCPDFPLRFKGETRVSKNGVIYETPGQIVTQFKDHILPVVKNALNEDERFIYFENEWFLKELLIEFSSGELDNIHSIISLDRELSSKDILKAIFKVTNDDNKKYKSFAFSLNCALRDDHIRRFVYDDKESDIIWYLAPPPKEVSFTLTNEALSSGYIKVSSDLLKIMYYYGIGSNVTLVCYGDYEIKGVLDESKKRISGQEIKSWYEENRLREKDRVYIKCPDGFGSPLRLYTFHEMQNYRGGEGGEEEETSEKIYLREKIYQILKSENIYLHYKQIKDKVFESIGREVELSSIVGTLSHESHLFRRFLPTRSIWGLAEWSEKQIEIDKTSLLLAIGEEDWVYRVLKDLSRPLQTKEIAQEIAKRFVISPKELLEINFINPNDVRLVKLIGGSWGLKEWVEDWKEEIKKVEALLEKIFDQKEALSSILTEKEDSISRLSLLGENENQCLRSIDLLDAELKIIEEELEKSSIKKSRKKKSISEIENETERIKKQICSLGYRNKIAFIFPLFSLIIFVGMLVWYFKPITYLFLFLFLSSLVYCFFNCFIRYKLKKHVSIKNQEKGNLEIVLTKVEEEELTLKNKVNQKIVLIEKYKKELQDIATDISEVKKKINDLEEKEKIHDQFLSQHDTHKLIQRKEELLNNIEKVL